MKFAEKIQYIKSVKKSLYILKDRKRYEDFVKKSDYNADLVKSPVCIKDKYRNYPDKAEREPINTSVKNVASFYEMHRLLLKKYRLKEIASADNDFDNALLILKWLTENTFYCGIQMHKTKDDSRDILEFSFNKPFSKAINCRLKAIVLSDCLVAVGIKAYPVCMVSGDFSGCHFTCRVYIRELKKWCAFDTSVGCWFSDENNNPMDIYEIRELFLQNKEPKVHEYNFNGTTNCLDAYMNGFLKYCISNLTTWQDNSMSGRNSKKFKSRKKFNAKLPI